MEQLWTLHPIDWPVVRRRCARCDVERGFVCTRKFRLNGNGRRLDAWLLYVCEACELTWRVEIFRRRTPEEVGAERLALLERNDEDYARTVAFDPSMAREADRRVSYRVERSGEGAAIVVRLALPIEVRLDRFLARELGLSRAAVARMFDRRELKRNVRDGQRIDLPTHKYR